LILYCYSKAKFIQLQQSMLFVGTSQRCPTVSTVQTSSSTCEAAGDSDKGSFVHLECLDIVHCCKLRSDFLH